MIGNGQYQDVSSALDTSFAKCASSVNQQRKAGEADLKALREVRTYSLALLNYIMMCGNQEKQLRAAIQVKLWFAKYKEMELFEAEQYYSVVDQVKSQIIPLFVSQSKLIADQLGEAIVNLAAMEFPDRWPNLMIELLAKVKENSSYIERIALLMTMLTYKYTYSMRSDPLYKQIIKVCDELHNFLYEAMESVLQVINGDTYHKDLMFVVLKYLMRLFYNLNYQDLHPLFEDNLDKWMQKLIQVIHIQSKDIRILRAKGEALKSILLFASKYRDDIKPVIENFSQEIWRLCGETKGDSDVVDEIQVIALKYFKHLIVWPDMKPFFAQHLENLLQILILPNVGLNNPTTVLFQDDPQQFVSNYFENNDIDSRRSTSIELLKSICRSYKFDEYLKNYLNNYVQVLKTQGQNLQTECTLLNLVIDAATVAYRSVDGVTSLGVSEDIIQYTYQQIVKPFFATVYGWVISNQVPLEINKNTTVQTQFMPIHISIYLRFVYYFRLYVPKEDLELIVKFCCALNSDSQGLKTIITMCVEAFVDIRFGDYNVYTNMVYYFDKDKLDKLAFDILKLIYSYEQKEKELNKQLTKTLFVLARRLENKCVAYSEHFMAIIQCMLAKTDSYDFKSVLFVFEALGTLVYYTLESKLDIKPLEKVLDDYFKKILGQGSDLLNFVFQIYALIVQMRPTLPQNYTVMYQSILSANNWAQSNTSLLSSYVQYILAYLTKSPANVMSDKTAIEVILTKLIDIKEYVHFYNLLWGILEITKLEGFFNSGYLLILLTGTTATIPQDSSQKKPAVIKLIIVFFCRMIVELDPVKLVNYVTNVEMQTNQISPGFLEMLLIVHGLPIISMIQYREERKTVFQGISTLIRLNLLSSIQRWATMLNALVENTNRRLASRHNNNPDYTQSVDTNYQRLWIFNKLETRKSHLENDQERFLVQSFKQVYAGLQNQVNIATLLPESSQEQLTRLINKYT